MKLKDRVALVVGGARGIGKAACVEMAKEGAAVAVADRQEEEAKELAAELAKTGARAIGVGVDVTSPEKVDAMMQAVLKEFGELNIVFHTAGWGNFGPFWKIAAEEWERMIAVNLSGTFYVAQAAAKQMIEQKKGGKILLTGSNGAVTNCNMLSHYCTTKAGVAMLARCMASELGNFRINVNVINPGCIETTMTKPMITNPGYERMLKASTPVGRWGQASEIGRLVVFLSSEDGDFINGQAINIDGGVTLTSVPAWFPLIYTNDNEVDWKEMHQHFPYADK